MAVGHSFSPYIEYESPHGERYRTVYEKDLCLDPVPFATCPVGSPLYWAYARPVAAGPIPFDTPTSFPPVAPRAATNALELYAAATGFPVTAHQTNMGTSSYAMFGVAQLNTSNTTTSVNLPAGIVVINDVAAMRYGYPATYTAAQLAALRIIRTRGVVQARVDGTTDVAVGDFLEGTNGAYNLILDAANANEGTWIALEARTANSVAMIWVDSVQVAH